MFFIFDKKKKKFYLELGDLVSNPYGKFYFECSKEDAIHRLKKSQRHVFFYLNSHKKDKFFFYFQWSIIFLIFIYEFKFIKLVFLLVYLMIVR